MPGPRVLGDEHADGADPAGERDRVDEHVQDGSRVFVTLRVVGQVADALAAAVGSEPHGLVQHSLHGVDLGVVDGDRSDLLGQREPVGWQPPEDLARIWHKRGPSLTDLRSD